MKTVSLKGYATTHFCSIPVLKAFSHQNLCIKKLNSLYLNETKKAADNFSAA